MSSRDLTLRSTILLERQMRTYYISPEVGSTRRELLSTLVYTAFSALVFVVVERVILHRHIELIDLAAFAIFFAAWTFWSGPEPGFNLEVDDIEIRVVRDGSVKQKVSRDRIRCVREWSGNIFRRPMLVISEHGPVGMRFLGFIAVPKSLPEYEQVKAHAFGWLEKSA
jgi:hypothetical protein